MTEDSTHVTERSNNLLAKFFGVVARGQTYLNLTYLFLAFPLGLFYFIFLVVGLSVGFSLIIVWIGLLILPIVLAGWWAFAAFERQLAIWLLRENIPEMNRQQAQQPGVWPEVVALLTNPTTWKSLMYLFVKFPLGILSFVVLVSLGASSLAFVTMPLWYYFVEPEVWFTWDWVWRIDTFSEAAAAFVVGCFLTIVSLHVFNGLAWVSGRFARVMLGDYRPVVIPAQEEASHLSETLS